MNIRNFLRTNPAVGYAIPGVLILLSLLLFVNNSRGRGSVLTSDRWAFDLATQTLVVAEAKQIAPFMVRGSEATFDYPGFGIGPSGVDTLLYTCTSCDDFYPGMTLQEVRDAGGRLNYVMRSPESPPAGEALSGKSFDIRSMVVSAPDAGKWFRMQSSAGEALRMLNLEPCPETQSRPGECLP